MRSEMLKLLQEKKFTKLREELNKMSPIDVVVLIEELKKEDLIKVFRLLSKDLAAEAFVEMDSDNQELLIQAFNEKELKAVIEELYTDDMVDIIEEMPANVVKRILKHTDLETRNGINEILKYPKDSAGSIMTIEYVSLKKNMTVEEAFEKIRQTGPDKETIYTCYVTEKNRKLLGVVTAKDLMLAQKEKRLQDIMKENVISVTTIEDKEEVAKKFEKYNFIAMPVVDKENRLVGIITIDDALDVIQEENTEDFARMAAISPSEDTYFKTSIWTHSRNRILWLLFLMLSATITGAIITQYEEAFAAIPLLVAFIPMIMGTGGNCGAQSSTMIIRGLALDDIKLNDFLRALLKEIGIALIIGVILALVNTIRMFIMYKNSLQIEVSSLSLAVGLTLILTVILAKALGVMLPMLAKVCRIDPAIMASPLITTIVDTCSVLIYFTIVTIFVM